LHFSYFRLGEKRGKYVILWRKNSLTSYQRFYHLSTDSEKVRVRI